MISSVDLATVYGHWHVKRAMEIAAAGGHNLLLRGASGVGNTLLVQAFPSLLPTMTPEEQQEVTSRHRAQGLLAPSHPVVTERPFSVPAPPSSVAEVIGETKGGGYGLLALAHHGALLLENVAAFQPDVIKAVNAALAQRTIASWDTEHHRQVMIPLRVQLIATMLPCPCGFFQDPEHACHCTPEEFLQYRQSIPGLLQPHFDLTVEVLRQDEQRTQAVVPEESSAQIRQRVQAARVIQWQRFAGTRVLWNAEMEQAELDQYCSLERGGQLIMQAAIKQLSLDEKDMQKILKVARTIADLASRHAIAPQHLAEAILCYGRSSKEE